MKRKVLDQRALYLFAYFFLIIAVFWTLKPLRTSSVVKAFGADYYPLFKQGVILILPIVLSVYHFLTTYLNRSQLVYLFVSFFILANTFFWHSFQTNGAHWVKISFFFHIDIYITIMVTLFFTYLNQIYTVEEAKRVWAYIGCGGLLGGILGSSLSGWMSATLGNQLILITCGLLAPILIIVHRLETFPNVQTIANKTLCPRDSRPVSMVFSEGISVVFKSKYLLCIVAIVGIYEMVSTIIDYQFTAAIADIFPTREAMAGFHGKVFFLAQVASLFIQLLVTPYIFKRFGVGTGLLFLPIALLIGSAAFLIIPLLYVITLSIGSEAAMAYSIHQVSKEILYVPLDNVSKVKGKAFIDMFVFRGAKAVSAALLTIYTLWLTHHGWTFQYLMVINIIAILIWIVAIQHVGTAFVKKLIFVESDNKG